MNRSTITLATQRVGGAGEVAGAQRLHHIVDRNGNVLHRRGVAIAIDHAARATVANELRIIEFVDRAQRPFPEMAAPELKLPIEIEVAEAAETRKILRLVAQETLHLLQRPRRIDDVNARFQRLDLVEQRYELAPREIDDAGIAITQEARIEVGQRIGKRHCFEAEIVEKGLLSVTEAVEINPRRVISRLASRILSHTPGSPRLSSCRSAVAASIEITKLDSPASAYSPMRRALNNPPLLTSITFRPLREA